MDPVDYVIHKLDALFVPVITGFLVVSFASWVFWKQYNNHVFRLKLLERKREGQQDTSSLKWQAYERIILFIERIRPQGMLVRLHQPGIDAAAFEHLLIASIREEYQHNVTQQLYVEEESWALVVQLKDTTFSLIRQSAAELPPGSTGKELSAQILQRIATLDGNPYDMALRLIRVHVNS